MVKGFGTRIAKIEPPSPHFFYHNIISHPSGFFKVQQGMVLINILLVMYFEVYG